MIILTEHFFYSSSFSFVHVVNHPVEYPGFYAKGRRASFDKEEESEQKPTERTPEIKKEIRV
jgi:hypothetical protein